MTADPRFIITRYSDDSFSVETIDPPGKVPETMGVIDCIGIRTISINNDPGDNNPTASVDRRRGTITTIW